MKKLLKWFGIVVAVTLLIVILLAVVLVTFVSPDRFKPLISTKVEQYTGRQLAIDGDLSWTLFPSVGIKTGHLVLMNPAGFNEKIFAEVENATISVAFMPLFHRQLQSDGIVLEGLTLHLIKNSQGKTNWDFASSNSEKVNKSSSTLNRSAVYPLAISIDDIILKNGKIVWSDEKANRTWRLEKLNFHANSIKFARSFPVKTDFDLVNSKGFITGHINLVSDVIIQAEKKMISFLPLALEFQMKKNEKLISSTMSGNMALDLFKQTLTWKNLRITSSNALLDGQLSGFDLDEQPTFVGHFRVQSFDMKKWLEMSGFQYESLQTLNNVRGEIDLIPSPNSLVIKGSLKIDEIKANNLSMTDVKLPMLYQDGVLSFLSMNGIFYQGSMVGDVKINVTNKSPVYSWQMRIDNFDLFSTLKAISPKQKRTLAGSATLDFQAMTTGNGSLLKNLNGIGHVHVANSVLKGVDLKYLIATAAKKTVTIPDRQETPVGDISASFVVQNGVVNNDDLLMHSRDIDTKGQGSIDLINKTLKYRLQAFVNSTDETEKKDLKHFYGLPIPWLIYGDLKDPTVTLDVETLSKAVAEQQLQKAQVKLQKKLNDEKFQEKAEKFLGHLLGN